MCLHILRMKDTLPELKIQITEDLILEVIRISKLAGDAIMEVYQTDFDVQIKDDLSPVTEADKRANLIIENGLMALDNSIPILSEDQFLDMMEKYDKSITNKTI